MNITKPIIAIIALALSYVLGVTGGPEARTYDGMPACATEDSTGCVWAARIQGNGEGVSFADIDGTLYVLDHRVAEYLTGH